MAQTMGKELEADRKSTKRGCEAAGERREGIGRGRQYVGGGLPRGSELGRNIKGTLDRVVGDLGVLALEVKRRIRARSPEEGASRSKADSRLESAERR